MTPVFSPGKLIKAKRALWVVTDLSFKGTFGKNIEPGSILMFLEFDKRKDGIWFLDQDGQKVIAYTDLTPDALTYLFEGTTHD